MENAGYQASAVAVNEFAPPVWMAYPGKSGAIGQLPRENIRRSWRTCCSLLPPWAMTLSPRVEALMALPQNAGFTPDQTSGLALPKPCSRRLTGPANPDRAITVDRALITLAEQSRGASGPVRPRSGCHSLRSAKADDKSGSRKTPLSEVFEDQMALRRISLLLFQADLAAPKA